MRQLISVTSILLLFAVASSAAQGVELGLKQDQFTIDGKPVFLLGCSYYSGLGASEKTVHTDLDELHRRGFNWIRVFADWTAYNKDLSAVDVATGAPRQPYLERLMHLCDECDRRGMIVDVTLARGTGANHEPCLRTLPIHRQAVETLVVALKSRRNWYLDLSNEQNIRDVRYTSIAELANLRDAAKKLDPHLLITASHGGDASKEEIRAYLQKDHLDLVSIHRERDANAPAKAADATRQYKQWIQEIGPVVPLQYDEPFRRGYSDWEPMATDFVKDLQASRDAGAAGWCFHNGDSRRAPDRQPRRSFDLQSQSLFEQLDAQERQFLTLLPAALRQPAQSRDPLR